MFGRVLLFALLSLGSLGPSIATAQLAGAIAGTVRDSSGTALVGVEVRVAGTGLVALSRENGAYRVIGVPAGAANVEVRRLGFAAVQQAVDMSAGAEAIRDFVLVRVVPSLAAVVVQAGRQSYSGPLAGYFERLERRSSAVFITRQMIAEQRPRVLSDAFRNVSGVRIGRSSGLQRAPVRMRGQDCFPLVWLDGTEMPSGDFDLDAIAPESVEGLEIYKDATSAPMKYQGSVGRSNCGTILLWTRRPSPPRLGRPMSSSDLTLLVQSRHVFTVADVDSAARPAAGREPNPRYPDALRAARTSGEVDAEFIIGDTGYVEDPSFGVISATSPDFVDAVREALRAARYQPAYRGGQAVRQLAQQRFRFSAQPPGRK